MSKALSVTPAAAAMPPIKSVGGMPWAIVPSRAARKADRRASRHAYDDRYPFQWPNVGLSPEGVLCERTLTRNLFLLLGAIDQGLLTKNTHVGHTDSQREIWIASSDAVEIELAQIIIEKGVSFGIAPFVINLAEQVQSCLPEVAVDNLRAEAAEIARLRHLLVQASVDLGADQIADLRGQIVKREREYERTVSNVLDVVITYFGSDHSTS